MKKIFYFTITTCLLLTSCTYQDNELLTESRPNSLNLESQKKVEKVLKSKTDDQRLSYRLLSENEKYYLWMNKLDELLENNSFSSKQINLINEIKGKIEPSIFKKENINGFKYITLKSWLIKARKVFSKAEINYAFSSINSYPSPEELEKIVSSKESIQQKRQPKYYNCSCSLQDDYCVFSICNTIWACKSDTWGCGTFWLEDCDGEC